VVQNNLFLTKSLWQAMIFPIILAFTFLFTINIRGSEWLPFCGNEAKHPVGKF
jgi:hypothetical protein